MKKALFVIILFTFVSKVNSQCKGTLTSGYSLHNPLAYNCYGYIQVSAASNCNSTTFQGSWTATLDGANYTYSQNTSFNIPATAGNHTLTVYDNCGCTQTYSNLILTNPPCDLNLKIIASRNVSHFYCSDGSIRGTATTSSCPGNNITAALYRRGSYLMQQYFNSGDTFSFAPLDTGSYTIVTTETNNVCTQTSAPIVISEPTCNLKLGTFVSKNVSHFYCSDGSIRGTATTSSCPGNNINAALYRRGYYIGYQYFNSGDTFSFAPLDTGSYTIVTTETNGVCTQTSAPIVISEPTCNLKLGTFVSKNVSHFYCSDGSIRGTATTSSCPGYNINAALYRSGYYIGYQYFNSGDTFSFAPLDTGSYTIVTTETNGVCTQTSAPIVISEPTCNLKLGTFVSKNVSHFHCSDGSIRGTATTSSCPGNNIYATLYKNGTYAGLGQYFNSGDTFSFAPLDTGSYTIVTTETNNVCTQTSAPILISEPTCNLKLGTFVSKNVSHFHCSDGSIRGTATTSSCPGNNIYATLYKNGTYAGLGQYFNSGDTFSFAPLDTGSYTIVTIETNNVCTQTSAPILISEPILGSILGKSNICKGSSQTYSVLPVSGATSYSWILPSGWTGSSSSPSIIATASNSSGTIYATANDNCGSTVTKTFSVTVNSVDTSITVNGFKLTSNATPASYQWILCPAMQIISGEIGQTYSPIQNGIYSVIIMQNTCIDTSDCYQVILTGQSIVENWNEIFIYPNPFNFQTTISFSEEQKNITIKIMDVLGKEIKKINFTGKELIIEKEGMKEGIYFVQVIGNNDKIVNRKIIIE